MLFIQLLEAEEGRGPGGWRGSESSEDQGIIRPVCGRRNLEQLCTDWRLWY